MSLSNFGQAVADKVRGLACQALNNPLIDGRQWGGNPPFRGVGVADNPLTRRWYNGKIDGLKALLCNDPTPTPEADTFPPPFTGGQCPTVYLVDLTNEGSGPPFTGQVFAQGPIAGVEQVPGIDPGTIFVNVLANPPVTFRTGNVGENWRIAAVNRLDTGADDCGDPVPPYDPVNVYVFNNEEITYVDNSNNTTNVLGDFRLFAPIFLPGSIQIPFTLNAGGLTLNGQLDLNGQVNFSPSFELSLGSGEDPVEGPEFDPEDQPDITEEDPSEDQLRVVIGAWVRLVEMGRRATMVSQGGVLSYYPRWGILKFQVRSPGGVVLTEGVDLKAPEVFVPAPEIGSVIGVQFVPYYGSKAAVRLAFASVPPEDALVPEE